MHAASVLLAALLAACPGSPLGGFVPSDAPAPGELFLGQIFCPGPMGEATILIGPDGTTALLDVGNDSHDDDVLGALDALTGERHVTATVLTHAHEDHLGAFDDLVDGGFDPGLVVSRGSTQLGGASDGFQEVMDRAVRWLDLCDDTGCAELPWTLPLGDGAILTVLAADARTASEGLPTALPDDNDGENARSLVGFVTWGPFSYVFAGDLTGGGKNSPDVEAWLAPRLPAVPGAASVLHLNHHGIDSSNHAAWLDRWLPADGAHHDVVVGTNSGYLDAPSDEVLLRLRDRLGGGRVWLGERGSLTPADELVEETGAGVVVRVREGGGSWSVGSGGL